MILGSLHGAHVNSSSDGHPQSWYTDTFNDGTIDHGERFTTKTPPVNEDGETIATGTNYYPNDQNACMLFFHDHALGITRLNVYAGLTGLYIIESEQKSDIFEQSGLGDILGNVERDIPLAFSDRTFGMLEDDTGAELIFPYGVSDAGGGNVPAYSILPENFGYTLTVNGKIWPKLEVEPNGFYLLRLLNAADRCVVWTNLAHLATFSFLSHITCLLLFWQSVAFTRFVFKSAMWRRNRPAKTPTCLYHLQLWPMTKAC